MDVNAFERKQFELKCCYDLAERARERFQNRRDVEWKTAIGLWSLFGLAAGAIIAAPRWHAGPVEAFAGLVIAGCILAAYRFSWLPYLAATFRRDQMTSLFWEREIEAFLGKDMSAILPKQELDDDLKRPADENKVSLRRLHTAQKCQFWIAACFGLLFVGSLFSRWAHADGKMGTGPFTLTHENGVMKITSGP